LYVVASFEDGSQYHFWAEELDAWEAATDYVPGERVFPTVPNGFAYEAIRQETSNPVWAPNVERQVGEVIEPTVENGFEYECIAVSGPTPRSGSTEPEWPEQAGATVIETTFGDPTTGYTPTPSDTGTYTPPDYIDPRYSNPPYDTRIEK